MTVLPLPMLNNNRSGDYLGRGMAVDHPLVRFLWFRASPCHLRTSDGGQVGG